MQQQSAIDSFLFVFRNLLLPISMIFIVPQCRFSMQTLNLGSGGSAGPTGHVHAPRMATRLSFQQAYKIRCIVF